jgi:hypothetical protein
MPIVSLQQRLTAAPEEIKTLFRIIILNNGMPLKDLGKLQDIVERGACDALPRITGRWYGDIYDKTEM